ncbi:MAG: nitrophenyl compound nitroreductase subunit ArsF family protein [Bacteroidales bacterium]|nr:nitrophenyl compound nitroreductase subunit ArsF family protein [Bacteroidales bacterium]MCF8457910.1 nitrophenyl compound nitroreductase subunit ArsF family protein [Bacteroidales bacterium]
MRKLVILSFSILFMLFSFNSFGQCSKNPKCTGSKKGVPCESAKKTSVEKGEITVYYFHNTRRCATCQAVESETQKALDKLYAEKVKNGKITFLSINIEEEGNEKLIEELEISGQTLLIVGSDKKVNLTTDAFMYAKTKPEKLEAEIKKAIDKMG